MSIAFKCACGERLEVDDEFAGQQARCPYCEAVVDVPSAAPPPPPAAKRAKLADPDETDDDHGAFAGSLNPLEGGKRPSSRSRRRSDDDDDDEYRPSRRRRRDDDDDDDDYRPRRSRRSYEPEPYKLFNKQVLSGLGSIAVAIIIFGIGLAMDRICVWPFILVVIGLVAAIRGLITGRDK